MICKKFIKMDAHWPNRFLFVILAFVAQSATGREVLPENCNCRDWYGACKQFGESWSDDQTWVYHCNANDGSPATFTACVTKVDGAEKQIAVGQNLTINNFWYSCEVDEIRQKYSQEPSCNVNGTNRHIGEVYREGTFEWICLESGRWVSGCFYQNETSDWVHLKVGETGYNGLIRHTCDRYKENPGRIQYHAEIRDDVPYKNPSNKGLNKNFPELVDKRLKQEPTPWTHQNAIAFIANDESFNSKVRYLPKSRNIHQPILSLL